MKFSMDMYTGPVTISQHKVPRKYLSAWTDVNKKIYTQRKKGNVFSNVVEGVEAEKFFYKFQYLNQKEMEFTVSWFRKLLDKESANLHLQATLGTALLKAFLEDYDISETESRAYLQSLKRLGVFEEKYLDILDMAAFSKFVGINPLPEDEKKLLYKIVANGAEKLFCAIEDNAWNALDAARAGNISLLNQSREMKFHLMKYMIYQMFRGSKIFSASDFANEKFSKESLLKIMSYVRYAMAIRVVMNSEAELDESEFILLRNSKSTFITGDSPVVNLDDHVPAQNFDIYFPISPDKALIYTLKSRRSLFEKYIQRDDACFNELNRLMCESCAEQVHSQSASILEDNGYAPRFDPALIEI